MDDSKTSGSSSDVVSITLKGGDEHQDKTMEEQKANIKLNCQNCSTGTENFGAQASSLPVLCTEYSGGNYLCTGCRSALEMVFKTKTRVHLSDFRPGSTIVSALPAIRRPDPAIYRGELLSWLTT